MGSRRFGVDSRSICLSDRRSEIQGTDQVLKRTNIDLVETGQKDSALRIFTDSNRASIIERRRLWKEQVAKLFIVNLIISVSTHDARLIERPHPYLDVCCFHLPVLLQGTFAETLWRGHGVSRRSAKARRLRSTVLRTL